MASARSRLRCVVLACAAALVIPAAAAAAPGAVDFDDVFFGTTAGPGPNLAPNPNFETLCSGIPCGWSMLDPNGSLSAGPNSTQSTGSTSLQVNTVNGSTFARGPCVVVTPGTGYTGSVWYATTMPSATGVFLRVTFFSDSTCGGTILPPVGGILVAQALPPVRDGAWHQISGTVTAPSTAPNAPGGANSALLDLPVNCSFPCVAATPAEVRALTAVRRARGVLVRWRTASELEIAGFNVFRQAGGARARVNRRLVAARGGSRGASYSWLDPRPAAGARYWIQLVNLDGSMRWYGPAHVGR